MKSFEDFLRPEIRALTPYSLLPPEASRIRVKLDFNESPQEIPQELKERVLERLGQRRWGHYPRFGAEAIREALAKRNGCSRGQVLAGNGSGELIQAALGVVARPGARLLLATPAFSLYRQLAAITRLSVETVPLTPPSFSFDEEKFLSFARGNRGPVIPLMCSPNNPTGGTVTRDFVRAAARVFGTVFVDQAYVEFAEPEDHLVPLLEELPGLVLFKTLSKAYSAAGFRIGCCLASEAVITEINKAVLPFNLDICAEELALTVLENPQFADKNVQSIRQERERVYASLVKTGIEISPSRANFLFLRIPGLESRELQEELLSSGILVRDMSSAVSGFVRITIGTPAQNDEVLERLQEIACRVQKP